MNGYRLLLRLAPRRLRARHSLEMEAVFRERLIEARSRGAVAVAAVWCRASADILGGIALLQRLGGSAATA